jgi:hypothetical protein
MKHFEIVKLDGRHAGHKVFTHYIVPNLAYGPVWGQLVEDKIRFFKWREWCWETWGAGLERDVAIEFSNDIHEVWWAWHIDDRIKRLYFRTEKELDWFILKWGNKS